MIVYDIDARFANGDTLTTTVQDGRDHVKGDATSVQIQRNPDPQTVEEWTLTRAHLNYLTVTKRTLPDE